jgi:D-alanyl-D-alanine carboxypeptidase (penicillin-binding protein 5/6)
MKKKFFLLFIFYTLLFLFYPGENYYYQIFAYNRKIFSQNEPKKVINKVPVIWVENLNKPLVTAEGIYVVDLKTFTPFLTKNEKNKFIPASTTKIITALVAYDIFKPEEIIEVKRVIQEGRIMDLRLNEKITVENLLYGLLVHSANDAAYALADAYGYEKFISLMNKKAKDLKMENTHFVDPAGLTEYNQYTTAYDLALASRVFLKNQYLSKIVSTKEIIISDVDFKYYHRLTNVNRLLGEIQGLGGLKTGYTENAGENLVSFYKNNNRDYVIVVLKSQDRFTDTTSIINWLNNSVRYSEILL